MQQRRPTRQSQTSPQVWEQRLEISLRKALAHPWTVRALGFALTATCRLQNQIVALQALPSEKGTPLQNQKDRRRT